MDFFASQDDARKRTTLLVFLFVLAVGLIVLTIHAVVAFVLTLEAESPYTGYWDPRLLLYSVGGTLLVVISGTLYKMHQLSRGGQAVAEMLGASPVPPSTSDPDRKRLVNVVEEMSIASGIPTPLVYVMEKERGINAFAAGFSTSDAVVCVTRGALERLNRDELQGVVAHEFSHILNGDMRLNLRLMGVLHGILVIALIGYGLMKAGADFTRASSRKTKEGGASLGVILLGLAIMAVGYIGLFFGKVIKAAVSRQREFLADAAAVQFTRNPAGLSGALKKVGGFSTGSRILNPKAEEASHLYFGDGLAESWFTILATHPPLADRIRRMDPAFDGEFPKVPEFLRIEDPPEDVATAISQVLPYLGDSPAPAPGEMSAQLGGAAFWSGFEKARAEKPSRPIKEKNAQEAPSPAASIVGRVGRPTREHLEYAKAFKAKIPAGLLEAAHEPCGAEALVYALLCAPEGPVRRVQEKRLKGFSSGDVSCELDSLLPETENLDNAFRLPLVETALAALKAMPPERYASFRANVAALIEADGEISVFEYTLKCMIARHLDPAFGKARPGASVRHHAPDQIAVECFGLLSCLAWHGRDEEMAKKAFSDSMGLLMPGRQLKIMDREKAGLEIFGKALSRIALSSGNLKRQVLEAVCVCIATDQQITVEEAELLRAVADTLDCPMPPFLPGELLAA